MKILTILLILIAAGAAHAGIEWTWVNTGTGTEQGTFVTDGELVAEAAPPGTYTVHDFTLTSTAYDVPLGSLSGGEFYVNQPTTGFDWDGTGPTSFWRNSGQYTNGLNIRVTGAAPTDPYTYIFSVGWFSLEDEDDNSFLFETETVILTPVGTVTAHQRAAFGKVKALYR